MGIRKVWVSGGAAAAVLLGSTAADAGPPDWVLQCDSENGCSFLSDGYGQEASPDPDAIYPNQLDLTRMTITVDGEDGDKCTWQWKFIKGRWQWVCVRK